MSIENVFTTYANKEQVKIYPLKVSDIEPRESVRLKCLIPICEYYGVCKTCPPNIPDVWEFRLALKDFKQAFIVVLSEEISDLNKYQTDFSAELKLAQIITGFEKVALAEGHYQVMGLTVGGCKLCDKCTEPGKPCRHPFSARPSPEGFGIDITELARKAGVDVEWPPQKIVNFMGLILV